MTKRILLHDPSGSVSWEKIASASLDYPDTRPDEIDEDEEHSEGAKKKVYVNRYERDKKARAECIDYYGPVCQVCEMEFGETYGAFAEGFIHVHHLVPLGEIGKSYKVDPIKDLRPVCPNCHAMIHLGELKTIEELRSLIS